MQSYRVKDGVLWCAGKRVPADRVVMLTEAQARHAPVEGAASKPAPQSEAKDAAIPRRRSRAAPDQEPAHLAPELAPELADDLPDDLPDDLAAPQRDAP